ncbi:unknown [Soft-shelled turtle iridovirus]|uniref:Uncharacterized protein n=1 Tax=Soft-shelled turtle iridovirus TaxID=365144 RepID=C3RWV4_FRG3V|nr:unknown [Soft-shelled turtle iridovirus]
MRKKERLRLISLNTKNVFGLKMWYTTFLVYLCQKILRFYPFQKILS